VTILSDPLLDASPRDELHRQMQDGPDTVQHSLADELALGRKKLITAFYDSPACTFKPGELPTKAGRYNSGLFRLRAGWACQFGDLSNVPSVIVDVYVPGDLIGLDTFIRTQRLRGFLALTSVTLQVIRAEDALLDLMADRSAALYILWLLGQRQRRANRRLAVNTCLEAQSRLAMMVLDFYTRLRFRRLITGSNYNLPLTQSQMGSYLGLSAVHVNRVLRSLRDERVVNLEKNCVTILDLERLRRLAHNQ
jgi:CRP/FNR family transcriptional regulator, anaerobic regulatory protein